MEVHLNLNRPIFSKENNASNPFLTKANLRANNLSGSIVLGNHEHLTELDISENSIEVLDLSALNNLKLLRCSKNRLKQVIINGRVLTSLIAGNNELTKLKVLPIPDNLIHLDVSYNKLTELPDWIGFCTKLRTIFASNNNIMSLPEHLFCNKNSALQIIQLEYNKLSKLPPMPAKILYLQELFLQRNQIEELPVNFFIACKNLILLNVSSNKLVTLPTPLNSFCSSSSSSNNNNNNNSNNDNNINNINNNNGCAYALERFYATNNKLNNDIFNILMKLKQLRVLHIAYNELSKIPDDCFGNWLYLEELILSGNKLQHLPNNLINLEKLKILRIHTNKLLTIPTLSKLNSLKVLDLAHNELENINLKNIISKKLQLLDLSFNKKIEDELKQLQECIPQRRMNMVNVCEQNKIDLLKFLNLYKHKTNIKGHWVAGFSETAGNSKKLYISQLRSTYFCENEGLFGMFDGEIIHLLPNMLNNAIGNFLTIERQNEDTTSTNDYMKYTLLSGYKEQMQKGLINGISSIICHISMDRKSTVASPSASAAAAAAATSSSSSSNLNKKLILRTASVGEIMAMLIRRTGIVHLTPSIININLTKLNNKQITNDINYIPNPELSEIILGEQDEYLVIINKNILKVMDSEAIASEIRTINNIVLAAKRIQDIAQSYGAEENLSIIIVKFYIRSEKFNLIKNYSTQSLDSDKILNNNGTCKCKHNNINNINNINDYPFHFIRNRKSDRSTSSGRSNSNNNNNNNNSSISDLITLKNRSISSNSNQSSIYKKITNNNINNNNNNNGYDIVHAIKANIDEENIHQYILETESALSEEQYKCWEYMLEKNTQLLFDKELNTLSKNSNNKINNSNNSINNNNNNNNNNGNQPLFALIKNKTLSLSSPQLSTSAAAATPTLNNDYTYLTHNYNQQLQQQHQQQQQYNQSQQYRSYRMPPSGDSIYSTNSKGKIPFLSKHFGSDRILKTTNTDIKTSMLKNLKLNSLREPNIFGGPNAAYFGSLQRLMPYNLEYDFNVIHERYLDDSIETDGRMRQYWGIATSEL